MRIYTCYTETSNFYPLRGYTYWDKRIKIRFSSKNSGTIVWNILWRVSL